MKPDIKNIMYHHVLDVLNQKYPDKIEFNRETAINVVLACEALEDIEKPEEEPIEGKDLGPLFNRVKQ